MRLSRIGETYLRLIGVDTGLMHLAAAFRKPGIGLYPATPPDRFGAFAEADAPALINLSRPEHLAPESVATAFARLFAEHRR